MATTALEPANTALLVLGMHRSGTSAAAGALSHLGVDLGGRLIEAADDNRKGYWEHADAVAINEAVLAGLSRSWDDVRALPADWLESNAAVQARPGIAAVLGEFSGSPLWALKDPRICRLAPLWLDALAQAGQRVACLFVLRHPDEVAASLAARDGTPLLVSHLLWARHILEAVHATRGTRRHMMAYDQLLADPKACFSQAARQLELAWPRPYAQASAGWTQFLDAGERNQRAGAVAAGSDSPASPMAGFVSRLYACCLDVVDGRADWSRIDAMQAELAALDGDIPAWIDALGQLRQADAARAGKARARQEREFKSLSAQVMALEAAKAEAEALAVDRLQSLAATDQRQGALETMVFERESQLQAYAEALAAHEAKGRADALEFSAQELALAHATEMAMARLGELETLGAALARAEALALSRLDELKRETGRIAELERMVHARPPREELDAALQRILALEAVRTGLEGELRESQVVIAALRENVRGLESGTQALDAKVAGLEQNVRELESGRQALEAEIAGMKGSLSWRLTAPFRRKSPGPRRGGAGA